MTDIADHAERISSAEAAAGIVRNAAVVARLNGDRASTFLCIECLDPIDEERREVAPGAERCLFCQEAHEQLLRFVRKE